jgi:hypothetical protein
VEVERWYDRKQEQESGSGDNVKPRERSSALMTTSHGEDYPPMREQLLLVVRLLHEELALLLSSAGRRACCLLLCFGCVRALLYVVRVELLRGGRHGPLLSVGVAVVGGIDVNGVYKAKHISIGAKCKAE